MLWGGYAAKKGDGIDKVKLLWILMKNSLLI